MDIIIIIVLFFFIGWFSGSASKVDEIKTGCHEERIMVLENNRFKCDYIGKEP